MTRLLITGVSGLLGLNLALEATQQGHQVIGIANQHPLKDVPFETHQVDLAGTGTAEALYELYRPEAVVHCAAVANLDSAEANPDLAWRLNADLPGQLAGAARRRGARFIYISTDAVFDGLKGNYNETDLPNPQGVYAHTKLAGEQTVTVANPEAFIARVNFYGWSLSGRRSLAEFFFNQLSTGQHVPGFTDVFFCPLQVNDLANLLLQGLDKVLTGIYHVTSRECMSKYAFGVTLARRFGLDDTLINPVSVTESSLVARRSPNLSLNTDKLSRALDVTLPDQAAGINQFFSQYHSGYPKKILSFNR